MANTKIKLIVGLGNPGTEYERTRHNVGFWFLEEFAKANNVSFNTGKFFGLNAKIISSEFNNLHLLMPSTFMNLSGKSVLALANFYKIQPEEILVIHDELDLPVGTARFKQGGGTGGHNGLSDIAQKFGNNKNFARLRIGIGRPNHKNIVPYVLGTPSAADRKLIDEAMQDAMSVLTDFINGNAEKAMHNLHTNNGK